MSRISIVNLAEESTGCLNRETFPLINQTDFRGDFGRRYYPRLLAGEYADHSYIVYLNERPCLLVECDITKGVLGRFTQPLKLIFGAQLTNKEAESIVKHALKMLDTIVEKEAPTKVLIEEVAGTTVSLIGKECVARRASAELILSSYVDLEWPSCEIHRGVRKSYKSLINWGEKNFRVEFVNSNNQDQALYESYKTLHLKAAGKVTRQDWTWEMMFEELCNGGGELTMCGDAESWLSGVMVLDGEDDATYGSAASDREKFDKPLGHWPLYLSILRSKERGKRRFILGDVPLWGACSEKEYHIGQFKKGFSETIEQRQIWTMSPGQRS